jgi:hypothetical protein
LSVSGMAAHTQDWMAGIGPASCSLTIWDVASV